MTTDIPDRRAFAAFSAYGLAEHIKVTTSNDYIHVGTSEVSLSMSPVLAEEIARKLLDAAVEMRVAAKLAADAEARAVAAGPAVFAAEAA